ncbi:very-long-chain aldehyde decarbonylase GL1-9-like [Malus domestica]|uniref:very-long-chain aldehyde decarbonylase GL1-9-like n=1 Tax=Malus domestica TaxID=3750 RepID=UPI003974D108
MDTWQFFVHRYMHQNKFLYRHVHSQHHRLVVPYAIGALYNHLLEGLLLDTFRRALSFLVSGMTARTAVIFFCFAVIKEQNVDNIGFFNLNKFLKTLVNNLLFLFRHKLPIETYCNQLQTSRRGIREASNPSILFFYTRKHMLVLPPQI